MNFSFGGIGLKDAVFDELSLLRDQAPRNVSRGTICVFSSLIDKKDAADGVSLIGRDSPFGCGPRSVTHDNAFGRGLGPGVDAKVFRKFP